HGLTRCSSGLSCCCLHYSVTSPVPRGVDLSGMNGTPLQLFFLHLSLSFFLLFLFVLFVFFFFQAEDGIRDRNVTGVQTCALPISKGFFHGLVYYPQIWQRYVHFILASFALAGFYLYFWNNRLQKKAKEKGD